MPVAAAARAVGENTMVSAASTVWLTGAYPKADAVMSAEPKLTPLTFGGVAGAVASPGMKTSEGVTVTIVESLVTSETNTPPEGAGAERVTGKVTVAPSGTVTLAGKVSPVALVSENAAGVANTPAYAFTV